MHAQPCSWDDPHPHTEPAIFPGHPLYAAVVYTSYTQHHSAIICEAGQPPIPSSSTHHHMHISPRPHTERLALAYTCRSPRSNLLLPIPVVQTCTSPHIPHALC
eukprot:354736-Chlamydomonas_euryale.AAC.2